ncbi:MAG TPA: hypothetical protein VIJ61_11330 [Thermoanaerobaculia bacterium]
MKKVVRLLAILIVLVAASAVPSRAILYLCPDICDCDVGCDRACWDNDTESPKTCGDWGGGLACYSSCGP